MEDLGKAFKCKRSGSGSEAEFTLLCSLVSPYESGRLQHVGVGLGEGSHLGLVLQGAVKMLLI